MYELLFLFIFIVILAVCIKKYRGGDDFTAEFSVMTVCMTDYYLIKADKNNENIIKAAIGNKHPTLMVKSPDDLEIRQEEKIYAFVDDNYDTTNFKKANKFSDLGIENVPKYKNLKDFSEKVEEFLKQKGTEDIENILVGIDSKIYDTYKNEDLSVISDVLINDAYKGDIVYYLRKNRQTKVLDEPLLGNILNKLPLEKISQIRNNLIKLDDAKKINGLIDFLKNKGDYSVLDSHYEDLVKMSESAPEAEQVPAANITAEIMAKLQINNKKILDDNKINAVLSKMTEEQKKKLLENLNIGKNAYHIINYIKADGDYEILAKNLEDWKGPIDKAKLLIGIKFKLTKKIDLNELFKVLGNLSEKQLIEVATNIRHLGADVPYLCTVIIKNKNYGFLLTPLSQMRRYVIDARFDHLPLNQVKYSTFGDFAAKLQSEGFVNGASDLGKLLFSLEFFTKHIQNKSFNNFSSILNQAYKHMFHQKLRNVNWEGAKLVEFQGEKFYLFNSKDSFLKFIEANNFNNDEYELALKEQPVIDKILGKRFKDFDALLGKAEEYVYKNKIESWAARPDTEKKFSGMEAYNFGLLWAILQTLSEQELSFWKKDIQENGYKFFIRAYPAN